MSLTPQMLEEKWQKIAAGTDRLNDEGGNNYGWQYYFGHHYGSGNYSLLSKKERSDIFQQYIDDPGSMEEEKYNEVRDIERVIFATEIVLNRDDEVIWWAQEYRPEAKDEQGRTIGPSETVVFGGCSQETWEQVQNSHSRNRYVIERVDGCQDFGLPEVQPLKPLRDFVTDGNTVCHDCGEDMFPAKNIVAVRERANKHQKKYPGFRRATVSCPTPTCNRGAMIYFKGDPDYEAALADCPPLLRREFV